MEKDLLAQSLIALLSREGAVQNVGSLTPEYWDYLGDLAQAVSYLRDARSVSALFTFVDSGNMVEDALASLGDESLAKISAVLSLPASDDTRRTAAVRVLRKMAQQRNLNKFSNPVDSRAVIKRMLIKALGEPMYFNRIEAVSGLAELGDEDTVSLIENVAADDSYSDTSPNTIGLRYPVRMEAQNALEKMMENR